MKSKLNRYRKLSHLPPERISEEMGIGLWELYKLLKIWIRQGIFPKNYKPYLELKKRLEPDPAHSKELFENYKYLRAQGLSLDDIATILEKRPERIERFDERWFAELYAQGLEPEKIADEMGLSEAEVLNLQASFLENEKKKKEKDEQIAQSNRRYALDLYEKIGPNFENKDDFIILDLEGVQNPDEILEIAAIDLDGNELLNTLVRPSHQIGYHVSKLTGISDSMARKGMSLYKAMRLLKKIGHKKTFLCWGIDYDEILIERAIKRSGIRIDYDLACAQHLHMGVVDSPKQIALYKAYGGEHQSHRALDDCKMLLHVLKEDFKELSKNEGTLL